MTKSIGQNTTLMLLWQNSCCGVYISTVAYLLRITRLWRISVSISCINVNYFLIIVAQMRDNNNL